MFGLGILLGLVLATPGRADVDGSAIAAWSLFESTTNLDAFPEVFREQPPESPIYMVDNTKNLRGVAPIRGEYNGAVWPYSGSFENYMKKLNAGLINTSDNSTWSVNSSARTTRKLHERAGNYWLPNLAPLGKQPLAGAGYPFYRDVTDYGASGKGDKDDIEAINAAIQNGTRCGEECGNTFAQGAIVYFPPGTYKICTPIIQYYYTQFIGDPSNPPIIKGCDNFTGIALIDTDPYIPDRAQPDGTGVNWYTNQNQFFRQIRNFVFDLTSMPAKTDEHGQALVPTGIHWQVAQGTSLQNLLFKMPTATSGNKNVTHVGIFTENGSGGFVSDLEFQGGAIGWRAGSQQYTARGLKFTNCITAVQMIWDWGFNWQQIEINGGTIGFNISGSGGITGQGIGSISLIDSTINNVPIGILTNGNKTASPNIVIDNTIFNNVPAIVQVSGGSALLSGSGGSQTIDLWAIGRRYNGGTGQYSTGAVTQRPPKPSSLLKNGRLFVRSRPQYETLDKSSFLAATDNGVSNDGTGDNTDNINKFLQKALAGGKIAYFPAGIYSVKGTVTIPTGSKVQGSSWSQIQGTGSYFQDMKNPRVVVKVGMEGDVGSIEIVEMMFTVKGPTAGAIMVEWNVRADAQGSAGMWDSHIRVGGALGSDLDQATCPKYSFNQACICASLLFHVTSQSSGYFENVWAWVGDHDNDMSLYWAIDAESNPNQVSLFGARGMLIESQGPSWFYGTASEHTVLYQYQLYHARNIYLGHIQTETPYFQPQPVAPTPFDASIATHIFPGDPNFAGCKSESCKEAWGLRVLDSENIIVHSAGLYSWFNNYGQNCLKPESCQERMMEVTGSKAVIIFNIFTKGVTEVGTGAGNAIKQKDSNQQGYTTEISVWIPTGGDNVVYIGTQVYTNSTAYCPPPCILVGAPTPLPNTTTITVSNYVTPIEIGTMNGAGTFVVTTITVTVTISNIVTDKIPVSNVNVTDGQTGGIYTPQWSIPLAPQNVTVTGADGKTTPRVVILPPWPDINHGPPTFWPPRSGPWLGGNNGNGGVITEGQVLGPTGSLNTTILGPKTTTISWPSPGFSVVSCPASVVSFQSPSAVLTLGDCKSSAGSQTIGWSCPAATTAVTIPQASTAVFSIGCTAYTITGAGSGTGASSTETDAVATETQSVYSKAPILMNCPPDTLYIDEFKARITLGPACTGETTLLWGCPPTRTVQIDASTDTSFLLGCILWTGTGAPLPVYTDWPAGSLVWVKDDVNGSDNDKKTTCRLWFFFICISWGEIKIGGWRWNFPKGILPPGPPPTIEWPPGITIKGNLPGPWPRITIGADGKATYPTDQPENCKTQSAQICSTTISVSVSAGPTTTTTATKTSSTCEKIVGCEVEDQDATKTTTSYCKGSTITIGRRDLPEPTHVLEERAEDACVPVTEADSIIYPIDPKNVGAILSYLNAQTWNDKQGNSHSFSERTKQIQSPAAGFTAFIYVELMTETMTNYLNNDPVMKLSVALAYQIHPWNKSQYTASNTDAGPDWENKRKRANSEEDLATHQNTARMNLTSLEDLYSTAWELSQISCPPDMNWKDFLEDGTYLAEVDPSLGSGQIIYVVEDDIVGGHSEFAATVKDGTVKPDGTQRSVPRPAVSTIPPIDYFGSIHTGPAKKQHGTEVTSRAWGAVLGLARKAQIILVQNFQEDPADKSNMIHERYLESLTRVLQDVVTKGDSIKGRVIVNMSFGWVNYRSHTSYMRSAHMDILYSILKELDSRGVVLVAAAHNEYAIKDIGNRLDGWPSRFGDPGERFQSLPNLIVVGGTDQNTRIGYHSPYADWLIMAPGYRVAVADIDDPVGLKVETGNSLATPLIVSVIAYWRGLPGVRQQWKNELQDPKNVKKLLQFMQRPLRFGAIRVPKPDGMSDARLRQKVPFIWTGRVPGGDCLINPSLKHCPSFTNSLADLSPDGACTVNKRQVGGSCQVPDFSNGDGGNGNGNGNGITFSPGPASPTCLSGCGTLCNGYFCGTEPIGNLPGFLDPNDPANGSNSTVGQRTSVTATGSPTQSTSSTFLSLPTLTSTAFSCAAPRTATTTLVCNGSGGHSVCTTSTICPPPSITTATGTNSSPGDPAGSLCPTPGQICIQTTTFVQCARAEVTARALSPEIVKEIPAEIAAPITAAPDPPKLPDLQERQGGCTTFTSCKTCATPVKTPCLDILLTATADVATLLWDVKISEDGKVVCQYSTECFNCQGTDSYDCGGGNKLKFHVNEVWYTSAKYNGQVYDLILPETGYTEYACGPGTIITGPLLTCYHETFHYTSAVCKSGKRQLGRFSWW